MRPNSATARGAWTPSATPNPTAQRSLAAHRAEGAGGKQTAGALNAVGWYHTLLGQHVQALDHCREALDLLQREPGYDYGEADVWDSIGCAHHHLGQYEEAATGYRNALALYRRVGVPYAEADTMGRLGDTYLSAGRPELAHVEWTEALRILERLDHADAERLRAKLRELPALDGHRTSSLG
ncbi:tetratricopeptide repeat protein [Streptomyces canus]|uniref:tetratricopeptide repeat protein n=1 Tax=Streptomyces canus TaxID=58343 RepID=UPI003819FFA6